MWVLSQSLDRLPLKKFYFAILLILLLGVGMTLVLSTQILCIQRENAKWVELVQRQSMLSQRMVKLALLTEREKGSLEGIVNRLSLINEEWSKVHFNLKFSSSHGKLNPPSSEKIEELILRIQPHKDGISDGVNELLMVAYVSELRPEAIHKIRSHEGSFLLLMEELVDAYHSEAEESITMLSHLKFCLIVIVSLALLLLLWLSNKIPFDDRKAFTSLRAMDKKEFFSETVADEFILSQASAQQPERKKENELSEIDVKKQILEEKFLTKDIHRINVLMIADESLPSDYIAWFLNKWEIDFSLVKNKELAQKEAQTQSFDMILMSREQTSAQEKNYFAVQKGKTIKIPVVTLEEADIKEIQDQIYGEDPVDQGSANTIPGGLYKKIKDQLSKETWGV